MAHYLVCPPGLVSYPEIALPPINSPDIMFDATCANNSQNTTTLQVRPVSSVQVALGEMLKQQVSGWLL